LFCGGGISAVLGVFGELAKGMEKRGSFLARGATVSRVSICMDSFSDSISGEGVGAGLLKKAFRIGIVLLLAITISAVRGILCADGAASGSQLLSNDRMSHVRRSQSCRSKGAGGCRKRDLRKE